MRHPSRAPSYQCDVTNTIDLNNPGAVTEAVCQILGKRFGNRVDGVVGQAFRDIENAFWGNFQDLLPCDTPYHDLRHSFGTALLMARMVDGYETARGADMPVLDRDTAILAVLLALFHDIGFLRRECESHLNGACLIHAHEQRSVDFMKSYLSTGPLASFSEQAELIHATNIARPIIGPLSDQSSSYFLIGQLLGTADLMSQMAGRYYLERCNHFLFSEFVTAGMDQKRSPNGEMVKLYSSSEDLLRKTPDFFEHVVKRRLKEDFQQTYRYIAPHFDGDDPYSDAIDRNMTYLRDMISRNDFSGMRRRPIPLMPVAQYDEWLSIQTGV